MVYKFEDVILTNTVTILWFYVLHLIAGSIMSIIILYKHYGYLEKHNTKHHTIIIIVIFQN